MGGSQWLFVASTWMLGCHLLTGVDELETGEETEATSSSATTSSSTGAGGACAGGTVDVRKVDADNYICLQGLTEPPNGPGVSLSYLPELPGECRVLLRTNLGRARSGLDSAELCLRQLTDAGTLGQGTAAAHSLIQDWEEAGVTWTQTAGGSDSPWVSPGGSFDGTPLGSADVDGSAMNEVCWDITAHVRQVWDEVDFDLGVILVPTGGSFIARFSSSETPIGPEVRLHFCP